MTRLQHDPAYRQLFVRAFGSPDVTIGRVEKALASFECTALSGNSPLTATSTAVTKVPSRPRRCAVLLSS